jgi:triphosphoribosyl-dephospho-CoA synthetase
MAYQDGFRQGFTGLDPLAALREPITSLLGVSAEAAGALGTLGIVTVFDLATAPVFEVAREIAEIAAGRGTSAMARLGIVPGGLLDPGRVIAPEALAASPVADLNAVDDALASTLTAQLQVATIGDLGRWPAFRAAQEVLAAATVADSSQDAAQELVPRLGEFPTERRFYQSVIIDHVAAGQTTDLAIAGPVDIGPTIGAEFGFAAPAVGARLTFAQSWFAHGVTLGNLLHSVALAPGESTRIAMLDWSRQTSASATEDITQAEQLTQATSHNRAVSEVQDAVAQEAQSGFSKTHADASTTSGGGGFGLSLGPLTIGGTVSGSSTSSDAQSFSASTGSRNLAASMNQKVMDSTQQAASSVRNRRASIVKEVSEQEHEAVSTRIVANYNHMHALTVQYFEVVELYRVSAHLHQAERCLFVPMKLVSFTDTLVAHYRGVLADAALDQRARELLTTEYGVVRVHPVLPMRRPIDVFGHLTALQVAGVSSRPVPAPASPAPAGPLSAAPGSPIASIGAGSAAGSPTAISSAAGAPGAASAPAAMIALAAWSADEMARAARIIAAGPARAGTSDLFLPDDAELVGVSFSGAAPDGSVVPISAVQVGLRTGEARDLAAAGPIDWSLAMPVPLQDLEDVRVSSSASTRFDGQITLQLSYRGARFPLTAPLAVAGQAVLTEVLTIAAPESGAELLDHLQQNRLHYSQAVWGSLDASSVALLLSVYTFESLPVADLIDPNPIMIAGNYLVFRMPGFTRVAGLEETPDGASASDAEAAIRKSWDAWLTTRGLVLGANVAAEELVSVPTGGVFAEAVLGRSNAAELLDATRFWNWQDSPIPLQPPEIAAIELQSRAQPTDVTPGQLGAPVLNIMNPTALPDPTGLAPMLGALQNGNMFRDMSGLAATVGLAQALGQATSTAATDAGKQAGANLAVAAQKDIEEKRIAAQLAMAAMGAPGSGSGTPKNITESGALLNTAKAMDTQAPKGQGTTGTSGLSPSGGGTPHGGGSGDGGPFMPGVPGSLPAGGSGSRADDVLSRALWGSMGVPGADIIPAVFTAGDGSGGNGGNGGAAAVNVEPFPATARAFSLSDNGFLRFDAKLDDAMKALKADPDTKDMCVAVVDLRPRPGVVDGLYEGYNDDDMLFVASLQKISPLYAAFELRARVRKHVKAAVAAGLTADAAGWKKMQADLKAAWRPKLNAAFRTLPPGFPDLAQIFTVSPPDDVDFATNNTSLGDLDTSTSSSADKFFESLWRMVRWSDDEAASKCILALSYPYINGLLGAAGFFQPTSLLIPAHGLWISGNYHNIAKDWMPDHTIDDANAGQFKSPRWQTTTPPRPKTNFGGTARQVAHMFALLAMDRLVNDADPDSNAADPGTNKEIRDVLSGAVLNDHKPGSTDFGSFIEQALFVAGRPHDAVFSKIGIGDDDRLHDGGIVERTPGGVNSRYAVTALGSPNNFQLLSNVFVAIDNALS